ncbi:MAG: DUF2628 domain-containing protein [Rhizobiaceae bacterium]
MASYVVMEPVRKGGSGEARFIRDGFALLGLLFPFFWLLWHRLWIEAVVVFAVLLCISTAGELSGWTLTAMLLSFLVSLYVGLEGSALRQWALRRRGWRDSAVIDATDEDEAMTRYFADGDRVAGYAHAHSAPTTSRVAPPPAAGGPALGLLSYPTRH